MSTPRVLVPLAPGFEEIEAMAIVDVLRRAGAEVVLAGLAAGPIIGAHDVAIVPDTTIDQVEAASFAMIALPGGLPGAEHLRNNAHVQAAIRAIGARGGYTAAVCAAPIALSQAGVTKQKRVTSYPGFLKQIDCAAYLEDRVVVDGTVVTSRGPGTAIEFALELVRILFGADKATALREDMLVR